MNVLIATNDGELGEALLRMLAAARIGCRRVGSPAELRRTLRRGGIDLVLCDELLALGHADATPWLAVVGREPLPTAADAIEAGAWDVIQRPVRSAEVLHRLGRFALLRRLAEATEAPPPRTQAAPLRERVRRYEMRLIRSAVEQAGGDRRVAAQRLGIGLSSLYRKLDDTPLPPPRGTRR